MKPAQSNYHSYLLRMWRVQGDEGVDWRATLEEVHSGELHGFPDLAALLGYLEALGCTSQQEEARLVQQLD